MRLSEAAVAAGCGCRRSLRPALLCLLSVQVGGGLAIPLAALGACAFLSFNKNASRELLTSRRPQIASPDQADEPTGDVFSVAPSISSPDSGEPATLGAPAGHVSACMCYVLG